MKALLIGISALSTIIEEEMVYIDKTEHANALIKNPVATFSPVPAVLVKNFLPLSTAYLADLLEATGRNIFDPIRPFKDIPFRTGLDNIYILLPETNSTTALKVTERIFSKSL